ncbi:hypothetical protein NC651_010108 [Populus alba x Populus x berolinensis]|nr:hypothetical protein NC651_010108 [Populus alba x Populus x berolinensis]
MILMTTKDINLVMFLLIIPFSALPAITVADHLFTSCSNNTSNYTLNSPFESNLKLLLENLPSITSLTGFNYTSFGEPPAKVYGQALCRGDVNSSSCQACVEKASQEIFEDCRNYTDAIIWYELCQVHYSFQNMTSLYVYTGKYPDRDFQEKFLSDPKHFSDVLIYLMTNLLTEAAVNPSKHMFATGSIKFRSETVYGHAQCTRDIIPDDCQTCLKTALAELEGCCSSRQGGIIVSRNCDVRFELYKYCNASSYLLTYPNPKGSNWKIGIVALAACALVVVIVIVIGSCIACLLKERGQQRGVERSHLALLQELACPRGVTMTDEGDKEAVVWGELCQLRYSNQRFLGHLDVSGNIPQQNPKNISNPEHLSLVVNKTLSSLIKKAAFGPSANMYATGDEPFTGSDSVFSLVQCSTDLSPNDCYTCLEVAIKNVTTCCYFSRGARIFSRSCYLRYELYAFYDGATESSQSPVTGKGNEREIWIITISTVASTLLVAWELWNNGKELEMTDPVLADSCCSDEFSRCVHIGLLCVQEDASERPAMSSVVLMLKSDNSIDLPQPQRPAIFAGRFTDHHEAKANDCSVNGLTVSDILPR